MDKVLAIVKQDLLVFFRNRSSLPSLLLTPAVMTIIIALVTGGAFNGPAVRRLDVIDQDHTQESALLIAAIQQANPGLTLCPMDNNPSDVCGLDKASTITESQGLDRVANSTSLGLLVIPTGYETNLKAEQPISLTFHSSSNFGASQAAEQAIQAAVAKTNAASMASQVGIRSLSQLTGQAYLEAQALQVKNDLYQQAMAMQDQEVVNVDTSLSGSDQQSSMGASLQQGLGQSVPGMGTMFVLMTIFGGMAALIVERQQWTLQRLAAMPVSRSTLLGGKILARFCLGILQFIVIFIVGALFGMNFGKDPVALALLAILYTLSITALSFVIGAGLKNPSQATGIGLLLALSLAPLGGAWWPMEISPKFLQVIGHISPIAWAMDGFTALTYHGAHLVNIIVPLGVLIGMTVVFFLIAIPRFRYYVD